MAYRFSAVGKPYRREPIKSHAIEAFTEYFEQTKDKKRIVEFVKKQLENKNPKTRREAKEFLKRWVK